MNHIIALLESNWGFYFLSAYTIKKLHRKLNITILLSIFTKCLRASLFGELNNWSGYFRKE